MNHSDTKRYTIAILLGNTQSNYSESLLRGFYTCAREENVNVLFLMGLQMPQYCTDIFSCNIEGNHKYQFDSIYEYVDFFKPDAFIMTYGSFSMFNNEENRQLFLNRFADIPYLLLEELPRDGNIPYLIADNYNGMRACVEHLVLEHGYTKIAFLSGPKNHHDSVERLNAYYDVMKENQLPVTSTMVAYGDCTELVSTEVAYLLDSNPGLEAIVCANDTMAKGCYHVCASRNLLVGRDIAITGFDDIDIARTMEPPLTTISHSSFQFSYAALKNAIALCDGKTPESKRMPVTFRKRCSCGCLSSKVQPDTVIPEDRMEEFILKTVGSIATDLLSGIPYKKDRDRFGNLILDYFHYVYITVFKHGGTDFHMDYLVNILKQFTTYQHVSSLLLLEHFTNLLRLLIANTSNEEIKSMLTTISIATQQHIHSADILKLEQEIVNSTRQAWFVPSFTRDLTPGGGYHDFRHTMLHIIKRLKMMKVKSAYFYFFNEPIPHQADTPLHLPDEIYLVAYFNAYEIAYYDKCRRPAVTLDNGIISLISDKHPACLTAFLLFSNEIQYGVMLCEVAQEDISFMQICSLQLGSLFNFLELNRLEHESQQELQNSLKVIQEQNHILSFISEYDELSQLLNRRGFMERALQICEQNSGKRAYLLFGDLDHLKEINDCFGHAAGDFAIQTGANRLRDTLPADAVTARIGGDEFVSLILSDEPGFAHSMISTLKRAGDEFNEVSDKPYYVEFSYGIYEFNCNPQIDLHKIIQQSDILLYQAKANRRKSIKK